MDWSRAKTDYEKGMCYREIAKKYKCKYGTVRVHARRHKWKQIEAPLNTKKAKRDVTHVTKKRTKNVTDTDKNVTPVTDDDTEELSPENEYYCYLRATQRIPRYKAYLIARKGFITTEASAMVQSSILEKKPEIRLRINKIQQNSLERNSWTMDNVLKELDNIFEQSVASIFYNGLNKANSDSAYNALDRIISLLSLVPTEQAKLKKLQFDSRLSELKAKSLDDNDDAQMSQLGKLMDKLEDDS
ncbi:hypothetical protein MOO46_07510 (plasmid) [Apilactobacillus apisilvae]|uniref:Terminase n=1 Tax=Apilactobacillus apisilvae TaxID=2923364 RepID=A0ABY4PK99_9LACO|nr:hypothetical protein [Apilactobacillus apisilvae]UQS85771.1 hypothetical protein MOO46_07510 [Apilactobacillus apisilvae]